MDNEILNIVKGTPNILGQVYTDLAQPSVQAVGNALGTVFEFSTSILLPIKLLNEKFKLNFTKRLNEYKDKLEKIPEEKRCEVHPQIGTPIIEKLTYTTNEEISDLFTTLLANASNTDMVHTAHPSFINMIEKLSPDEARIIKFLKDKSFIPYCDYRGYSIDRSDEYDILKEHLTLLPFHVDLKYPDNMNAYFANLISLGILIDKYGTTRSEQSLYKEIKETYDYENFEKIYVPKIYSEIESYNSFFNITDFGKLFINACVK